MIDLRRTLEAYREVGVQLRRDKCRFGYQEGEFVGHIISADGHRPAPATVTRISEAPQPKCRRELQRFLGMANYYREYIPKMAEIAEPLYDLTSKDSDWVWNNVAETAFRELKRCLADYPATLAFPDWDKDFYLETDASGTAVSAVLLQRDREGLRPIAYFSSGLTESQKKYSAGELECWASIAASRKFQKYLQATNKVITTPLCWLRRQKDPRHKFARWIQELES